MNARTVGVCGAKNKIMIDFRNVDCCELLKSLPDGSVDLMLQDTPFGVTQNTWDIAPDLQKMWPEWLRVGKGNCAFVFFATQPFASDLINSNRKIFRYDLIWYKKMGTGFLNANKMPLRNHETILVFYRKLPTYNPQMKIGKRHERGFGGNSKVTGNYNEYNIISSASNEYHPESIIDFSNGNNNDGSFHPTQKPIDLIRYLIKTYSNPGDTVFDGYAGSGTTPEACIIEDRNFIGSEWCPDEPHDKYYIKAIQRIKNRLSKPTLL